MIREDEHTLYRVVVNHQGQYSIWRADDQIPLGWTDVGKTARKSECLDYLQRVWTDMTPLSARTKQRSKEEGFNSRQI
jgi:MbtH protein